MKNDEKKKEKGQQTREQLVPRKEQTQEQIEEQPVCYIVGAGPCGRLDFFPKKEDCVIAADGGLRYLKEAGIHADMVVGDFDTLGYEPAHENVVKLQVMKDWTDTFVAMEKGRELGYETFVFYGCLGGKPEHTIANLQHLAWLTDRGMTGWLAGEDRIITMLKGPGALFFPPVADGAQRMEQARRKAAEEGRDPETVQGTLGLVSVFAHTGKAKGVTLRGLKYPLKDAELTNTFPLGISNEFTGQAAEIRVTEGMLLIVLPRDKAPWQVRE